MSSTDQSALLALDINNIQDVPSTLKSNPHAHHMVEDYDDKKRRGGKPGTKRPERKNRRTRKFFVANDANSRRWVFSWAIYKLIFGLKHTKEQSPRFWRDFWKSFQISCDAKKVSVGHGLYDTCVNPFHFSLKPEKIRSKYGFFFKEQPDLKSLTFQEEGLHKLVTYKGCFFISLHMNPFTLEEMDALAPNQWPEKNTTPTKSRRSKRVVEEDTDDGESETDDEEIKAFASSHTAPSRADVNDAEDDDEDWCIEAEESSPSKKKKSSPKRPSKRTVTARADEEEDDDYEEGSICVSIRSPPHKTALPLIPHHCQAFGALDPVDDHSLQQSTPSFAGQNPCLSAIMSDPPRDEEAFLNAAADFPDYEEIPNDETW